MITFRPTPLALLASITLFSSPAGAQAPAPAAPVTPSQNLLIWYRQPATQWTEAIPLGNGRLGAMVYGGVPEERLQLNEDTVYAGGPHHNNMPTAREAIPEVRRLIFEGKYQEAHDLTESKIMPGRGKPNGMPYQTVGELRLKFPGHEKFSEYRRELSLDSSIARTSYSVNGVRYTREIIASIPDQVIVVHLTASKPGALELSASWTSPHKIQAVRRDLDSTLVLAGTTSDWETIPGQLKFEAQMRVVQHDGTLTERDATFDLTGATNATLLVAIGTNYVNYADISASPTKRARDTLKAAAGKDFATLRRAQVALYRSQFERVKLDLGVTESALLPTDERLRRFGEGNDPHLAALYFQFGRYLLIASSQPGTQPANLQGIWNDRLDPPWDSKYTVNINTEMNYWPAESTNLTELHEPLLRMIREVSVTGADTAKTLYGASGWVLHHNTDLWRMAGPVDGAHAGMWPTAGAWFSSQHLWGHYLYQGDGDYLKSIYPVMKGAAQFLLETLVEEPTHKWLVVTPSLSPENTHRRTPNNRVRLAAGVEMDNQLVFELFSTVIRAGEILRTDGDFRRKLATARDRLPPMRIGRHNQLQEWLEDWDDPKDQHRHISHLYGLHPANLISPRRTPELFAAARQSLEYRGDVSTGWSMGWKVNCWARFLDGNRAYKLLTDQLRIVEEGRRQGGGGTYANLFDAHPPFQIDGNFGCTAGLAELFVQSHDGAIDLVPALPNAWPSGSVSGLRARGGFVITALSWKEGRIAEARILSQLGGICRVRSKTPLVRMDAGKLTAALGENRNPYFFVPPTRPPLISPEAKLPPATPPQEFVYDIKTKPGQSIALRAAP